MFDIVDADMEMRTPKPLVTVCMTCNSVVKGKSVVDILQKQDRDSAGMAQIE